MWKHSMISSTWRWVYWLHLIWRPEEFQEERRLVEAFRLMAIDEGDKENLPPKETEDLTVVSVRHGKKLVPRSQEAEAVDEGDKKFEMI